jgi:hypothetical protein
VKHASHLHIRRTAIRNRQIALVRLGSVWLILVGKIAQYWLAHDLSSPFGSIAERSPRLLGGYRSCVFLKTPMLCPILL